MASYQDQAASLKVGVVGLGVGTMAAYCRSTDRLEFYELDRRVVEIANRYFRFLNHGSSACEDLRVHIGDGRVFLRNADPHSFDVLVLDAFSSDSVPFHLLTAEAFSEYRAKLAVNGTIAVHLSNRRFDLVEPVVRTARSLGLQTTTVDDFRTGSDRSTSLWTFVSGSEPQIETLERQMHSFSLRSANKTGPLWTDFRYSVMDLLR